MKPSIPEDQIDKLGEIIFRSKLFGCKDKNQGTAFALLMIIERLGVAELARRYHLVEGRLMLAAGAAISDFRKLGGEYEIIERTAETARVKIKYQNHEFESTLTWDEIEEAKEDFAFSRNGVKLNWSTPKRRREMLWYRLMSDAIVAVCPEVYYSNETNFGNVDVSIDMVAIEAEVASLDAPANITETVDSPAEQPEEQAEPARITESVSSYEEPTPANTMVRNENDLADESYVRVHVLSQIKWFETTEDPDKSKAKVVREFRATIKKKGKKLTELTYKQIDALVGWLQEKRTQVEIPF